MRWCLGWEVGIRGICGPLKRPGGKALAVDKPMKVQYVWLVLFVDPLPVGDLAG